MKKEVIALVFVTIFFACLFIVTLKNPIMMGNPLLGCTKEENIYHCPSIEDCLTAIAEASPGDTILFEGAGVEDIVDTALDFGGADNLIFDCLSHESFLKGDGVDADSGILLNDANNNTIRNCNISNFQYGIYVEAGSNNTFFNVDISSTETGINFISNSFNNTVINSIISKCTENGIQRGNFQNDGNSLIGVNISKNKNGIYLEGGVAPI